MRVFLTGASGFIGAETLRQLLAGRHNVAILLRDVAGAGRIAPLIGQCRVIPGRLGDADWHPALQAFRPEAVLHLAWQGVGGEQRNDLGQLANIAQAVDLATAAADAGACHWVGVGSQAEYGPCGGRLTEAQAPRPVTLYGACKLCAGLTVERICAARGLRFAWLRLFSSYGPGDNPSWMITGLIDRLLHGERPRLTLGEQRWDYLHVRDVARALVAVLETPTATGPFNLGSGVALPLRDIMESVRDMIDPRLPLGIGEIPYRPDQVMHLEADPSRLMEATGWRPQTPLADGLRETIAWHRHLQQPGRNAAGLCRPEPCT